MKPLFLILIDVTKCAAIVIWILILIKLIGWVWKQLGFKNE